MPEIFQVFFIHRNKNYINSLWLGVGWNLLSLPYRVFTEIVKPIFHFNPVAILSFAVIPVTMWLILWHGITGRLSAAPITLEHAMSSIILTPQQGREAIEHGETDVVLDVSRLIKSVAV